MVLPEDAPEKVLRSIANWGVRSVRTRDWSAANEEARRLAQSEALTLLEESDDSVFEGYGTLGLGTLRIVPGIDLVVISRADDVVSGVASSFRLLKPGVRVVVAGERSTTEAGTNGAETIEVTLAELSDAKCWIDDELAQDVALESSASVAALLSGKVDMRGVQSACAIIGGAAH